jgi:hypothetical protein
LVLLDPEPVELIPIESGVEDRGTISESFRVQPLDLRLDTSFEKLYKVAGSEVIYVRKSGGLSAVFRNSEYAQTPLGEIPIVPAGTTYYIGELPTTLINQISELQEPIDTSQNMVQVESLTTLKGINRTPNHPDVRSLQFFENEAYRRRRLASFVLEIVLQKPPTTDPRITSNPMKTTPTPQ